MKGFLEFFGRVLFALNDTDNMDPNAQRSWRRLVAALVTILCLGTTFSFLWAQGWVPGLSGVALAADLVAFKDDVQTKQATLEKKQDALALLIVKGAVRSALNDRCTALARRNQQALNAANGTLEDLADQYRQLTGRELYQPSCQVVLIDPDGRTP